MARMLGNLRRGGCSDSRCRLCHAEDTTRRRKRAEARQWPAAELPGRGMIPAPYADLPDCEHGCNGDCVVLGLASDRCGWQCHPGAQSDPSVQPHGATGLM